MVALWRQNTQHTDIKVQTYKKRRNSFTMFFPHEL